MRRNKTIKGFLYKTFSGAIGVTFIIIFTVTFLMVENIASEIKGNGIANTLRDSSANLTAEIQGMYNTARAIAADKDVYDSSKKFEDKKDKLVAYAEALGISSIGYITGEGYLTSTDGFENDISEREYFQKLMKGIDYISNPSFNTATNKQIIFIGVPLYENGNIVAAMTCTFDSSYLSELVSSITYMGEGSTYMLSSDGTVVASKNMDEY